MKVFSESGTYLGELVKGRGKSGFGFLPAVIKNVIPDLIIPTIQVEGKLTFDSFQLISHQRHQKCWKSRCKDWGLVDWSNSICNEAGELAGYVKKYRRGDYSLETARPKILKEAADVITYVAELCTELDADMGTELIRKFNEVSARPEVRYGFPRVEVIE